MERKLQTSNLVLILVIVDYSGSDGQAFEYDLNLEACFNPCYSGL